MTDHRPINDLRRAVLAGEEVSLEELKAAVSSIRAERSAATQASVAKKEKKAAAASMTLEDIFSLGKKAKEDGDGNSG